MRACIRRVVAVGRGGGGGGGAFLPGGRSMLPRHPSDWGVIHA